MLKQAFDTPWRAANEMRRRLALPTTRLGFRVCGVHWGHGWRVSGMPIIQRYRGSKIELGDNLELRSWPTSNPLAPCHPVVLATRRPEAVIRIGHHCGFTGATIVAAEQIEIGNWVTVGANSVISDSDFHPLNPDERRANPANGRHRPIIIEDDVFLGMNCLVLKGVRIGRGSIVGAGSVVTRDVPPGVVVAGNPAQIVGSV